MNVKTLHGRGNHLIIEAFDCNKNVLSDVEAIKNFLNRVPYIIETKKLGEPVVVHSQHENKRESGISGFVIILDSHVSIHTYPEKRYASIDIYSCKEFDIDKVIEYVKEFFETEKIETETVPRGIEVVIDLPSVKGSEIRKGEKVSELIRKMKNIGLQATNVARAVEVIKKMERDNATIFLTFTSNMVSSGLREIFAQLAKEKKIDVIITTVGSVEEDFIKSGKSFLLGDFNCDDAVLHKRGINRIGNILVPNDRYVWFEEKIQPILKEMYEEKKIWSPHEVTKRLGEKLNDKNSFLYWCAKNNIPVFCQAMTDGAFGLQLYFFKQEHNDFIIDETSEEKLAEIVLNAEKTGGIILGGGVAKHHAIGVNILRGGFDYAVYVTTATPYDGSLSGARTNEAISWSKLKEEADHVCIEADASIVFPLIVSAWLDE